MEDFEHCYRAVKSRDPRFDGWFFTAVTTTGIYCRPSCPARTPAREHVRFYPTAAAAQLGGFRACMRCRPDAAPGSPAWNLRADVVGRAMRLVADGVVDREGVRGLAGRLGYGTRHLDRLLLEEVGAGPLALARAQRAQTARALIESSTLAMSDVAFAAGFSSVRQFNDTVRLVMGTTPSALRARRHRSAGTARAASGPGRPGAPTVVSLRLSYRRPIAMGPLLDFLGARAIPGVERYAHGTYERALRLPHGHGSVALVAATDHVAARLSLVDLRDLAAGVARCRRLLDLDADPVAIDSALGEDALLRPLVAAVPGRRVPGSVDGFELAVRAVIGQQVSVASARALLARLVSCAAPPLALDLADTVAPGERRDAPVAVFPSPEELLEVDPPALGLPRGRAEALAALARAAADGSVRLDPGADPLETRARLLAMRGIGPWTASYVAMRALGDPDTFLPADLGVRQALRALGLASSRAAADEAAARWRPWRAYAAVHLWGLVGESPSKEAE